MKEFGKQLFSIPSILMFALGLGIGACLILYPFLVLFGIILFGALFVMWKKRENIGEMLENKTAKKGDQSIDAKKEKFFKEMQDYMEKKQKRKEERGKRKEERISETE
jgi:Flp pilus assembly protein TadB